MLSRVLRTIDFTAAALSLIEFNSNTFLIYNYKHFPLLDKTPL